MRFIYAAMWCSCLLWSTVATIFPWINVVSWWSWFFSVAVYCSHAAAHGADCFLFASAILRWVYWVSFLLWWSFLAIWSTLSEAPAFLQLVFYCRCGFLFESGFFSRSFKLGYLLAVHDFHLVSKFGVCCLKSCGDLPDCNVAEA